MLWLLKVFTKLSVLGQKSMNITTNLTKNEYFLHIPEIMIRFDSLHPKFSKLTKDEVNTMLRLSL